MMTPQQLIDMRGYGNAEAQLMKQGDWDYDYPDWFILEVNRITGVDFTENQRQELTFLYHEVLEGFE